MTFGRIHLRYGVSLLPALARLFAATALDALLPPRCLSCGALVAVSGGLCGRCWSGVTFIAAPVCQRCGLPFPYEVPGSAICGHCARHAPPWMEARSAVVYDDGSRSLLLRFKHADATHIAPVLASWSVAAARTLLERSDAIVPVPLHWTRLLARRYNQSAVLAHAVGRRVDRPVLPDALIRRRRTRSQGGLARTGRRRNVDGAFAVRKRCVVRLRGKRVLLVDDVFTTGATVAACSRALLRAGAASVDVLTVARVV